MSKNQGGIVQYVDFHREEPIKIISETKKSSSRKRKISEPKISQQIEKPLQQTAELVQFVKPVVDVAPEIATEVKKKKVASMKKSPKKVEKVAKKTASIKSVKKVAKVKKTVKKLTKKAVISEEKANSIRAFFEKNKAYYDIEGILSNTKDAKITILKDVTNEKIHKKAMNAIIKSVKSSRKFKFELAS